MAERITLRRDGRALRLAAMRLRLSDESSRVFRAMIAAIVLCGVALTIGLAAAPQLHSWLHKTDDSSHECAATLMSNGSWNHSTCPPVLTAPQAVPVSPAFVRPGVRVIARVQSSILEHAPPANS